MPVIIRLTVYSNRIKLSLGQKVVPEQWNQQMGIVIGNTSGMRCINADIEKAKVKLRQHYDQLAIQL